MLIRLLGPSEGAPLRALRLLALQESPEAFAATYDEEVTRDIAAWSTRLADPQVAWFGAFDGERLVSKACLARQRMAKLAHKASVFAVYTHPDYRGRGLSEQVLRALIEHARSVPGLQQLTLSVVAENGPAVRLYQRLGFTTWGREPQAFLVDGALVDEFHMALPLHARAPYPTPHQEVNELVDRLLVSVKETLGEQFVGLYLHGSLASGDFDPARSEIDFLVVTRSQLPPESVDALRRMHEQIGASPVAWARRYEGSYIPLQALRRYDPANSHHPALSVGGSVGVDKHHSDWVVQRYIIREQGIVVAGPSSETLIDPVTAEDLRQGVKMVLEEWWLPQVDSPVRLQESDYQAYTVLTMCRALYTLRYGALVSKRKAGEWAATALGEPWAGLIEKALAWRPGLTLDALSQSVEFIRYTTDYASGRV